jgi:glycosyltransferase involved in cell wall biosynthesis
MRVLVVTHNYPRFAGDPAGAFVARLAAAAQACGHSVLVVAPHAPGTEVYEVMDGVTVYRFRYAPEALERVGYTGALHRTALSSPLAALGVAAFVAGFRRAIARAVHAFGPHLIHAHWWIPGGWLASRIKVPYMVTCHGSDVRLLTRAHFRRLASPVFQRARAITTVSRFLASDIRAAFPELATPITVAPMPVNVAQFAAGASTPKAHPPRILYAGNLVQSKGVDLLIQAFALLRQRGIHCQLRILGQGPEEPSLHALAARLGVDDAIEWSPFLPQSAMPAEYGASTVTVLPTRGNEEGLGLVLVEALLAGCAVVGTPAGGIPEVVVHERTGLLAREGDAADLAAQIERLLTDDALRARLVREGREHVAATYAPDAAAQRFVQLYRYVAGNHLPR